MASEVPEGMIPVSEFGKLKGIPTQKVVDMIRDGFYVGRKQGEAWYIDRAELEESKAARSNVASRKDSQTQQEDGFDPKARRNAEAKKPAFSSRRLVVLLSVAVILLLLNVFGRLWPGADGFFFVPSSGSYTKAENECEEFVRKEIANPGTDETRVFDTYKKRGKIVVEVGYREKLKKWEPGPNTESYSVRLCVYDNDDKSLMIPGLVNWQSWAK